MENRIAAGKGGFGLSNNQLKIIAMLSMLADHMGMILFPEVRLLRIVGRLAFPIFAFMIAEGCAHTRNRGRYLLQMAAVALVCQIAYAVAMAAFSSASWSAFFWHPCPSFLWKTSGQSGICSLLQGRQPWRFWWWV